MMPQARMPAFGQFGREADRLQLAGMRPSREAVATGTNGPKPRSVPQSRGRRQPQFRDTGPYFQVLYVRGVTGRLGGSWSAGRSTWLWSAVANACRKPLGPIQSSLPKTQRSGNIAALIDAATPQFDSERGTARA